MLDQICHCRAPVLCTTSKWTLGEQDNAADCGSHKSAIEYQQIRGQNAGHVGQEVLDHPTTPSFLQPLKFDHLTLGVVPQRERRPGRFVDYSFSGLNQETRPLAFQEAMQFGHVLERVLQAVMNANPEHDPIYPIYRWTCWTASIGYQCLPKMFPTSVWHCNTIRTSS